MKECEADRESDSVAVCIRTDRLFAGQKQLRFWTVDPDSGKLSVKIGALLGTSASYYLTVHAFTVLSFSRHALILTRRGLVLSLCLHTCSQFSCDD